LSRRSCEIAPIHKLKEIHTATHPAAKLGRKADHGQQVEGGEAEILAPLDAAEEPGEGAGGERGGEPVK
jgi:hypothetical protein